ncbi:hypothetical protein BCE75_11310 [Isoptericola sp. CG 20/1183]|uniref:Uncharacterized protein n=1 Tax=Isoptericola halotolerans TaxID=300560 RepID=A0ABX5ECT5_9MICO|nr:hypothetical protein BCE75_11310 [Isoptericola sp. CG 20/1183]PRZ03698.1 hypothetical protein BCL65_11210 [Isoptericola halotolerans]
MCTEVTATDTGRQHDGVAAEMSHLAGLVDDREP